MCSQHQLTKTSKRTCFLAVVFIVTTVFCASAHAIVKNDYDGDGKSDPAVWRPANGTWYVLPSSGSCNNVPQMTALPDRGCYIQWGLPGDEPILGDYDGLDYRNDYAVWRPQYGLWFLRWSFWNGNMTIQLGLPTDYPSRGDFDGDNKTDITVFRPSTKTWYIRWSSTSQTLIYDDTAEYPSGAGINLISSTPMSGYYYDFGCPARRIVYIRYTDNSQPMAKWYMRKATDCGFLTSLTEQAPASDIALYGNPGGLPSFVRYRPATGQWFRTGVLYTYWQPAIAPIPVMGDFDGDGWDDITVWDDADGYWYLLSTSGNMYNCPAGWTALNPGCKIQWGLSNDVPMGSVTQFY